MRKSKILARHLLLILVVLSTLSCDTLAALRSDSGTSTPKPPKVTSTSQPQEDLPPLPAPKLLSHRPEINESHGLEAPIELVFDQPMDQESVEDAFRIRPRVRGDLVWADARTLRFSPKSQLDRGTAYEVMIQETARNAEGTALVEPVAFAFDTVGFVEVVEVQPAPGSEDVDTDAAVTVIFNRPIVPLMSVGRPG